ncbi:MAG: FlgD immunoglobulin-like domain containing protein, partial [Candidatus Latescibacterota bacterium]
TLWPPNHKMVQVASGISASDIADENPSVVITVTSDEDINGTGDGNTEVDWEVIDGSVYLRAERDGGQDGRVYTVTVVATDAAGNTTTVTGTVDVPHGQEVASADNGKGKGKAKKLVVVSQSVTPSIVVGEAKLIAGQSSGTLVTQGESVTIVGAGPVVADQLIDLSDNAEVAPAVQDRLVQRNTFLLSQNYPNPFNPETVIGYALGEASDVRLIIYNVLGQQVRELVNASQAPGQYSVRWDGRNALGAQVTSGVYIYRLVAGTQVEMRKMILLK